MINTLAPAALARPQPTKPPTLSAALLQHLNDRYQLFIHDTIDRLFGEQYEKQLKALGGTSGIDAIPPMVKQRNRQAGYAGVSFLLYLSGAPVLMASSIAINLYLGYVMIQIGLRDMWQKRTLTARAECPALLGSQRYTTLNQVPLTPESQQLAQKQQAGGHSLVYLAVDGLLQGMLELQPTIRPEAQSIVNALHARGLQLAMITGDQEAPAQALAATLGIDRVFANILPEQKAELVRELQEEGRHVMFVGDGINDSIALKQAHVSVSIAGATTVATDTAQIVLMDGTLAQLDALFDLSHRYARDMRTLYVFGVHVPAAIMGGVLLLGWGLISTYIIGYLVFFTELGVALRPIWRQERLEARQQ